MLHPIAIAYGEAIAIASLGLAVNMTSAWLLLRGGHYHHDDHDGNDHHPPGQDPRDWSDSENAATRLRIASRKRRASSSCSKPATRSSA
jgi:Co/Zn/Cd efflux system component